MKSTLVTAVEEAFRALGDLVSPATLTNRTGLDYDWSTGKLTGSSTPLTLDAVIIGSTVDESSANQVSYDIVVKRYDHDLSLYDSITIGGATYTIESMSVYEVVSELKCRKVS